MNSPTTASNGLGTNVNFSPGLSVERSPFERDLDVTAVIANGCYRWPARQLKGFDVAASAISQVHRDYGQLAVPTADC
jgi:hypothetical protein